MQTRISPGEVGDALATASRPSGSACCWLSAPGQFLQGILYGVNGVELVVLVTATLVLLAASLLASFIPALRATRIAPTVALRSE